MAHEAIRFHVLLGTLRQIVGIAQAVVAEPLEIARQARVAGIAAATDHARRRELAEDLLGRLDPGVLRTGARDATNAAIDAAGGRPFDAMTLVARRVPVRVLFGEEQVAKEYAVLKKQTGNEVSITVKAPDKPGELKVRVEVPVPVEVRVPVEVPAIASAMEPFKRDEARREQLGITARELEILELIADGLSNREIAGRLFVSENTVKTHAGRLFDKLSARRRTQAVQRAKEARLIA